MIDTSGTRYKIEKVSDYCWVFNGWKNFLNECGLTECNSFMELTGTIVDKNRRSMVYQIDLGKKKRRFYLKIHKDYIKKNLHKRTAEQIGPCADSAYSFRTGKIHRG